MLFESLPYPPEIYIVLSIIRGKALYVATGSRSATLQYELVSLMCRTSTAVVNVGEGPPVIPPAS